MGGHQLVESSCKHFQSSQKWLHSRLIVKQFDPPALNDEMLMAVEGLENL